MIYFTSKSLVSQVYSYPFLPVWILKRTISPMHPRTLLKLTLTVILTTVAYAQKDAPPNSQPNPYNTVENWAKLPEGRSWGSTSAVSVDRDGKSIWVGERCGANSCAGKTDPPVLKFDSTGKLVKSFGAEMFIFPHGLAVDKDGNI